MRVAIVVTLSLLTAVSAPALAAAQTGSTGATGTSGATGPAGPTGTSGPAAAPVPTLRAGAREAAWGGHLQLRVGPADAAAKLQRRARGPWRSVATLRAATRTRVVRIRVPLAGPTVAYRIAVADAHGPARSVALRAVSLASVGDVNLGDVVGHQIDLFGGGWPWASVGPTLRRADISFANLECAISTRGSAQVKQYTFRGRPSSLQAARRAAGLDVVNLANNHAVDFGRVALLDTIRTARDAGIATVGAGANEAQAYRPVIVERLGLRIAFVSFSQILPFEFRAGPRSPGTAWAFPGRVESSVRAARRTADVVVASFHWGVEKATHEDGSQRSLARLALASGADVVIGAHPHVQQPVRRIGRHKLIAYSLGNFVFGAHSANTSATKVLQVGLASDGVRSVGALGAHITAGRPILNRR